MASYVCTIAGGKGGVGRTTTAINLGIALHQDGYDVIVVDADLGMANLGELLGVEPEHTVHDVLTSSSGIEDALIGTGAGIDVLAGDRSLGAYADVDPAVLSDIVRTLRDRYEVVLMDTSAGILHETTVAMGVADGILLVATASDVAAHDAEKIAALADRVDGTILGVVLTRVRDASDAEGFAQELGVPVLGVVPYDPSLANERSVLGPDDSSPATKSYRMLGTSLTDAFFEGADPIELDPAIDEAWFDSDEAKADPTEADSDDSDDDDSDDDDSGDVLGMFN